MFYLNLNLINILNGFDIILFYEDKISKFYAYKGKTFDKEKTGVWLDNYYAIENNINVGDKISISTKVVIK